jgi:hypothetical protein
VGHQRARDAHAAEFGEDREFFDAQRAAEKDAREIAHRPPCRLGDQRQLALLGEELGDLARLGQVSRARITQIMDLLMLAGLEDRYCRHGRATEEPACKISMEPPFA